MALGWPGTHYEEQASLKLKRGPHASASQMLGLKVYVTMPVPLYSVGEENQ